MLHELTIDAKVENLDEVLGFLDPLLEAHDFPMKAQMQLDVAVEELFVNIAHYAYAPGEGSATIRVEFDDTGVAITLIDGGIPYDPLAKEDPDVTLSAEDRQIGGLGIFLVKKTMDRMTYARQDEHNVLTIRKNRG